MGRSFRCEHILSSPDVSVLTKSQGMIDRKLEPLIKRLMTKYLGELDDDDLVMFVVEHLKDHKGPHKLVEGLEPVSRDEEAHPTIALTH